MYGKDIKLKNQNICRIRVKNKGMVGTDFTLRGSKCPLLLHCGHSICSYCLQQNFKSSSITCQLCGFISTSDSSEMNKGFPFNFYMLGNLLVSQNSRFEKDKRLAFLGKNNSDFNYGILKQGNIDSKPNSNDIVCEECSLKASWHCENCKSNFCEICWARVHGSAKSLTKHFRTAIHEAAKIGFKKCLEHETQDLEFFCMDCSKTICSHCVILQHQGEGHHSVTLKEKNLQMLSKVRVASEDADKLNKRMKQTLEEIKLKRNLPDSLASKSYADLENQVARNFSRLHGILQLEEEKVLKKLHEKSNERQNCFRALQTQLEEQMEAVEYILRECEIALKKPQNGDLTDLYRQLTEIQNLPCYLISTNTGSEKAKVEFDERLIDSLPLYCTLDLPSDETFELRSGSDLPEGYAVDPLNTSFLEQSAKEGLDSSISSVSDIDNISNSSSRELPKDESDSIAPKVTNEPKIFSEKKSYCVRISFIKNPGEFYVTLNSQRGKQRAIDRQACLVARMTSTVPQTYKKGDIYLVKYTVDKKWYRGRVMEVISSKRTGEDSVLIYYLDYGNFETVPISRLRPIPPDLLEEQPLAIKCKLFDCVPQDNEWCEESTKTMEKILKNHTATMFVMKVHSDCLEVDLSVIYLEGQIGRDIVSVRDALLFLGFSSFVHGFKVPRNGTAFKYLDQCLPSAGENFDVTVTHVNSPSDFYVQRTKLDASYLYNLAIDLQSYYQENFDKGIIYNPVVDMPCAALFTADEKWYRAKIVEIPGRKMVTVFYVDYGNKETIQWTEIRKLKESFAKCPPLAYNCSLAGITPIEEGPWSAHAKFCLKKYILMKEGHIVVQGKSKIKQKLKVLLYKKRHHQDVCLNSLLVEMGLAVKSCNSECLWALHSQEDKDDIKTEEKPNNGTERGQSSFDSGTGTRNRSFQDRKKNKPSAKELREKHESEKKNTEEPSPVEHDDGEVDEYKNIFRVKVDVLSAESPSSIYVTFPTLMEEFETLQAKLNDFYQDSTPPDEEWKVGSACAVLDSTKRCWFRGSIQSMLPDNKVQVFLKDIARVTSEPVSALRVLDPFFKKYSTCAIKCHLADIKSPGDRWPGITSEFLSEELDNHKMIYMTKRGQTENGSLPVELWVQRVLPRGALEPIKKEWITLNRLLVDQGLAIPDRVQMWSEQETEDDDYSDEEKSIDVTQTESSDVKKDVVNASSISVAFVPSLSSGWIPPLPLTEKRFIGIPTYVDFNAFIYMYDIEKDEENLKKIREVLLEEYGNTGPNPADHFWVPGQLCVARYHADNFWYRGLVLQENEDMTYDVLFVDYGNVETCQVADLRKKIKTHEIPILTHKFQLNKIETVSKDGEWPESVIDIIHSLIVDKKCEVTVLKRPQNPSDSHIVTLKVIESDIDVGTFLVEKNLALFDFSDSDIIPSDNGFMPSRPTEDDSVRSRYSSLSIPDNCTELCIGVTHFVSETEFFAHIIDDESLPSCLKKILNEHKALQEELAKEYHLQPLIENLTEGEPCCCLDFVNNKWCRGMIESFNKNKNSVCVFYVDYGTKEFIHKDFIRCCKDEWVNLPKMAVKFKIGDIDKCENVSESTYKNSLINCLNKMPLFAQILNKREDLLEVKLFGGKGGDLAYQSLIDEEIVKFI